MFICMRGLYYIICLLSFFIAGSNYLLHALEGEIVFINEQITINTKWRGVSHVCINVMSGTFYITLI